MDFYMFANEDLIDELIDSKFKGILFVYNAEAKDYFSIVARKSKKEEDFVYIVAVRPYVISPQYISMIFRSFNYMGLNNLRLNLISGYIKDNEKDFGGILGSVNDQSSSIDKSKYLIEYIKVLQNLNKELEKKILPNIDYYVSTTNSFVFDAAEKDKMILNYYHYIEDINRYKNKNIMVVLGPILRETEEELRIAEEEYALTKNDNTIFCKEQELNEIINNLSECGVKEILFGGWPEQENSKIINFVKKYKESVQ